jgi:ATP-dependent Clp protease ATP-binding subunit ClpX
MSNESAVQTAPACSFCAKPRYDVATLIAGQSGYICDECITQCGDLVNGGGAGNDPLAATSPRALFDYLSSRVIGQEAARKQLAVSVFHHQFGKRGAGSARLLRKQNLLFLGPTGCGKTWLLQTLARGLDIPFVNVSATAFTQTGYVGDDVDSMLRYLLERCDNDVEKAQSGIVFIDEIDKIASRAESQAQVRDVSGAGVQQNLLTMMEGTTVRLPAKGQHPQRADEFTPIDTQNIMFVAAGAFVGLEDIVARRLRAAGMEAGPAGYGDDTDAPEERKLRENDLRRQVCVEDLVDFGLLPEFAGRFTACVPFDHLLLDDLIEVLNNPQGSPVHEYRRYFHAYGVELVVGDDALRAMAELAEQRATGARGLRAIVDACLHDAMFELPEWEDVARMEVTRESVLGSEKPRLFTTAGASVERW